MTLWVCDQCSTAYAVGLHRCPRCTGSSFHEEGQMPKISVTGGATNAAIPEPAPVEVPGEGTPEAEAPAEGSSVEEPIVEPEPIRPADSASKGAWVEYAVASGLDREGVEGMLKRDIQALFEVAE